MEDKQIAAMQQVVNALNGLDESDLRVVLGFISMRYGPVQHSAVPRRSLTEEFHETPNDWNEPVSAYESFPDLYHAANPETESDKALVAGYWIQVCQGKDSFDSYSANSALKDMGYSISNITRAFDSLMAVDPKYVQQIRKSGTTRQARKLYKLTQAGQRRISEMFNVSRG